MELCENFTTLNDGTEISCENEATVLMAGEQDSFGTEWLHLCPSCKSEIVREVLKLREEEDERAKIGVCSSCRQPKEDIGRYRDSYDQPYEPDRFACKACRIKVRERDEEEMAYYESQRRERF